MAIKLDGVKHSANDFAGLWLAANVKILEANAKSIFDKFPDKYGSMTDIEQASVIDFLAKKVERVEKCLGVERIQTKKKM